MKTRTPKLSPAQHTYAAAKALVETLRAECNAEFERLGLTDELEGEGLDRAIAAGDAIEERLGYTAARVAFRKAEKALVAWAAAIVKQRGHYALVAPVFEKPLTISQQKQLVDLCFRLAA